jgi:hypothetical protein
MGFASGKIEESERLDDHLILHGRLLRLLSLSTASASTLLGLCSGISNLGESALRKCSGDYFGGGHLADCTKMNEYFWLERTNFSQRKVSPRK